MTTATHIDSQLRSRLSHVLWLGGSPCSGKSSIATILGQSYGLQVYSCDDAYVDHLKRATPSKHPVMSRAAGKTWDEVWMHPVEYLVNRELAFYREEFEMVVEDLLALPDSPPILAEGAALLPDCVSVLLNNLYQAIWVVPTEEFQRAQYARRDWVKDILNQCRYPQQAWENWMGRDAEFARAVAVSAKERGLSVLDVDVSSSLAENAEIVSRHLGLRL
jgi:2-phosphoglycerate kinase